MENTVPILVTAYNRPEHLKLCLDPLKNLENPIFISIDGPRQGKVEDSLLVEETVAVALNFIKSKERLFISSTNMGLSRAVTSAVDQVFKLYDRIIVLEDDIILNEDAIYFYETCLLKFVENRSIAAISAINYVPKLHITDPLAPYRLSNYAESWGWATWSDRWKDFSYTSSEAIRFHEIPFEIRSISTWLAWRKIFKKVYSNRIDSWAYKWMFSNWKVGRKFLVTNFNLTSNLGFGPNATNTKNSIFIPDIEFLNRESLASEIQPKLDVRADHWLTNYHFKTNPKSRFVFLTIRLRTFFKRVIK